MNFIRLVFSMTQLMEILNIQQEEQLLIKFEEIKHLILLKILNMMNIKGGLLLSYTYFLIKSLQVVVLIRMQIDLLLIMKNQLKNYTNQLLEKLEKRTVYSGFKDNIWGANLAYTQLINKFNKGFRFLLCVIYICSKYVIPLKDKKDVSIVNVFQRVLDKSGRKPNKI